MSSQFSVISVSLAVTQSPVTAKCAVYVKLVDHSTWTQFPIIPDLKPYLKIGKQNKTMHHLLFQLRKTVP